MLRIKPQVLDSNDFLGKQSWLHAIVEFDSKEIKNLINPLAKVDELTSILYMSAIKSF